MTKPARWAVAWGALAAALVAAGSARAAPPALVAIGPVTDARPTLVRQLREKLCAAVECVPWGTVSSRRGFDLARARSANIEGILVGAVKDPTGRHPVLVLSLFERKSTPAARWQLPVRKDGNVALVDLARVTRALEARFASRPRQSPAPPRQPPDARPSPGGPPPQAAPPAAARPPRAPTGPGGLVVAEAMILSMKPEEPSPERSEPPRPSPALDPAPPPPPPDGPSPSATDLGRSGLVNEPAIVVTRPREDPRVFTASALPAAVDPIVVRAARGRSLSPPAPPPWLAIELGVAGGTRELSFQGTEATPGPLRGHRVPLLFAPAGHLELQPGAWLTDGALAGLSLQGSYSQAVGLQTDVLGVGHPTRMSWLSAGLAWRSAPPGRRRSWSFGASWERREATVSPPVIGLPDRRLSGAKVNAGVAQPLGRTTLSLAVGYVHWLEAPDLVAGRTPFFPAGSAWGVEAEAGVGVRLSGPWSLLLSVECGLTRYGFERDPAGFYAARSALDAELRSRFALRFEL